MRRSLLAGAGGLLLMAAVTSACTSDSEETTPAVATEVAAATTAPTEAPTEHAEEHAAANPGDMLAALIHIDGAGFHGMDDALNGEAPEIQPSWLGATQRARVAALAVTWPESMQELVDSFVLAAEALEAALEADDMAAAAEPAALAHEVGHELSHEAYHAIGDAEPVAGGGAALAALRLIQNARIAEIAEAAAEPGAEINAGWLGRTGNAAAAARAVAWPGESQAAADAFVEAATALQAAIEAEDLAATGEAAAAASEAAANLSTRGYGALSGMRGTAASNGALLAALAIIDGSGFHDMDDALNGDAPEVDPAWAAAVTRAKRAAQTVVWPEDAKAGADAFIAAATALEAALTAKDVDLAVAAEAAIAAHETQHDLSHDAYAALGGDAGGH